jgi:hypothetical protein
MPWDLSHKFLPSAKSVHTTIGASSELETFGTMETVEKNIFVKLVN